MTTSVLTRAGERLYRMPVLLLVLCAIFWAGNTVAARLAIGEIDPFMLTALRWLAVAAVLWPTAGSPLADKSKKVVAILSGGNVSAETLAGLRTS